MAEATPLICADCIRDGKYPTLGTKITANPPFAVTVFRGFALCREHAIPAIAPDGA